MLYVNKKITLHYQSYSNVAQSVVHRLGKIKNDKLQQLITLKNHPSFGSCLCGAAGSAQPW